MMSRIRSYCQIFRSHFSVTHQQAQFDTGCLLSSFWHTWRFDHHCRRFGPPLPAFNTFWIKRKLFLKALPQFFFFAKFVTLFEVVQIRNMISIVLFPGSEFVCWIKVSWSSDLTHQLVPRDFTRLSIHLVASYVWSQRFFSCDQCYRTTMYYPYLVS